jgi:hypothetical protein
MNRIRLFLLLPLLAGCSLRGTPEDPVPQGLDGRWQGRAAWIDADLLLTFSEGEVTGTGTITQNPVEGTWQRDDLTLHLSTMSNTSVNGTWTASWGSGSLGGLMGYPLLRVTLRREGETTAAARFTGVVQEEARTLQGVLVRGTDSTQVSLVHSGPLPVAEIQVTGRHEGDRVTLDLGNAFQFAGDLASGRLGGTIVASNVGSYTLFLRQVRED